MSFHNKPIVILVFLAMLSCKGLQYYHSSTNPAKLSIVLQTPSAFYTNVHSVDSAFVFMINNNSEPIVITNLPAKLSFIGQSRFYKRELVFYLATGETLNQPITLAPGDTVLVSRVPLQTLFNTTQSWNIKNKPAYGPQLKSEKAYHPYVYLTAQMEVNVPNQQQLIKIRTESKKIEIKEFTDPGLKSKKTTLSLTSDVRFFNTENPSGNLICNITNIGTYPIPLFNDPGSVRFKIYAYNPNRTSVMYTEYILNNGKLPVQPLNIQPGTTHTLAAPLNQLLFKEPSSTGIFYWVWNKKNPPVSPLIYGKKEVAMEVEFWFGVVVDGKEYVSNTLHLPIEHSVKRKLKKSK